MGEVIKIHEDVPDPQPVEIHTQVLHEMAISPELMDFQIVCHWKDGKTTTGWSDGIKSNVMAFGVLTLDEHTRYAIYRQTGQ